MEVQQSPVLSSQSPTCLPASEERRQPIDALRDQVGQLEERIAKNPVVRMAVEESAGGGDAEANLLCGLLYSRGVAVTADPERASQFFEAARLHGVDEALVSGLAAAGLTEQVDAATAGAMRQQAVVDQERMLAALRQVEISRRWADLAVGLMNRYLLNDGNPGCPSRDEVPVLYYVRKSTSDAGWQQVCDTYLQLDEARKLADPAYQAAMLLRQQLERLGLDAGAIVRVGGPEGTEYEVSRIGKAGRISLRREAEPVRVIEPGALYIANVVFNGERLGIRPSWYDEARHGAANPKADVVSAPHYAARAMENARVDEARRRRSLPPDFL